MDGVRGGHACCLYETNESESLLVFDREEVAQHRQIFDSRAAYQMLSKELLGLLR